ncbi:GNAT family N-acetyltransferase [Enterovibrio nigricans]|uniref:Acetyltransferase (GNAT) family protein n=1 Tax=Enterovibrio nigricans DSM 22720 TaxID=1121868 RepID=A0A1T4VI78_9GAMM|nr:GNAT family N-acetyltransferase [Enterovibrio nigricans]PKF49576.1 N-acetyltransferase [Enterovibrio nigricans]SKA64271.1 Acetyltransferase (GNAT) family protein [Enterovibrio nigricans DSM 22720]
MHGLFNTLALKPTAKKEFQAISDMEKADDTHQLIIPHTKDKHLEESNKPHIIYLSIIVDDVLSGFIILALEGTDTVEFRRIVVGDKGKGIGQSAIRAMENYCSQTLTRKRIWLDVFETNTRGKHIYSKLGYQPFSTSEYKGNTLLLMEKTL